MRSHGISKSSFNSGVKVFLDTNAFLKWVYDERLPKKVQRLLAAGTSDLYVSIITPWEIAIKESRIHTKSLTNARITEALNRLGAQMCPVLLEHIEVLSCLPCHHRDPFDRMVIAQAICEDALLLSSDERFPLYRSAGLKLEWD